MTEEDQLKWWTNFKIILIINYNFIQTKQFGNTDTNLYILVYYRLESL